MIASSRKLSPATPIPLGGGLPGCHQAKLHHARRVRIRRYARGWLTPWVLVDSSRGEWVVLFFKYYSKFEQHMFFFWLWLISQSHFGLGPSKPRFVLPPIHIWLESPAKNWPLVHFLQVWSLSCTPTTTTSTRLNMFLDCWGHRFLPNLCFTHSLLLVSDIFAPCWVNFPSKERETNPQIRCFGFSMDEHTVDGEIRLSPVENGGDNMILLGFQPSNRWCHLSVTWPWLIDLSTRGFPRHCCQSLHGILLWVGVGRPTPMRFWAPRSPERDHPMVQRDFHFSCELQLFTNSCDKFKRSWDIPYGEVNRTRWLGWV